MEDASVFFESPPPLFFESPSPFFDVPSFFESPPPLFFESPPSPFFDVPSFFESPPPLFLDNPSAFFEVDVPSPPPLLDADALEVEILASFLLEEAPALLDVEVAFELPETPALELTDFPSFLLDKAVLFPETLPPSFPALLFEAPEVEFPFEASSLPSSLPSSFTPEAAPDSEVDLLEVAFEVEEALLDPETPEVEAFELEVAFELADVPSPLLLDAEAEVEVEAFFEVEPPFELLPAADVEVLFPDTLPFFEPEASSPVDASSSPPSFPPIEVLLLVDLLVKEVPTLLEVPALLVEAVLEEAEAPETPPKVEVLDVDAAFELADVPSFLLLDAAVLLPETLVLSFLLLSPFLLLLAPEVETPSFDSSVFSPSPLLSSSPPAPSEVDFEVDLLVDLLEASLLDPAIDLEVPSVLLVDVEALEDEDPAVDESPSFLLVEAAVLLPETLEPSFLLLPAPEIEVPSPFDAPSSAAPSPSPLSLAPLLLVDFEVEVDAPAFEDELAPALEVEPPFTDKPSFLLLKAVLFLETPLAPPLLVEVLLESPPFEASPSPPSSPPSPPPPLAPLLLVDFEVEDDEAAVDLEVPFTEKDLPLLLAFEIALSAVTRKLSSLLLSSVSVASGLEKNFDMFRLLSLSPPFKSPPSPLEVPSSFFAEVEVVFETVLEVPDFFKADVFALPPPPPPPFPAVGVRVI